jgi:hypothetical protein
MKYVAVMGDAKINLTSDIIFHYFDNYLASMGEPTTSKAWTLFQLNKHFKKIIKGSKEIKNHYGDKKLFIDSGGFQIIVGYINKNRVNEYIDSYHFLLKKYKNDIDYIFFLDIMNKGWSKNDLIKFNDKSFNESIKLINKYPELKDKQIFICHTRTLPVFELWNELMDKHQVYNYYERYSFGGLVGLKKETNAKFSHFVPFTFWLISKILENKGKIKHIHMLGQSSRLAIFTSIILENLLKEKFNLDIDITMDSSELMRFTKIDQKLPLLTKINDEFILLEKTEDIPKVIQKMNLNEKEKELAKIGKIDNELFIELVSQNIYYSIELGHKLFDNLKYNDLIKLNENDLKEMHFIFNKGRLTKELINNLDIIKTMVSYLESNDIKKIENKCKNILKTY